MGKMTVYHGSYTAVASPQIILGHNTKDFGPGFYCTIIREQAERWARRYNTPIVSAYTVRINTGLNILDFKDMTEEWLDFIITCSLIEYIARKTRNKRSDIVNALGRKNLSKIYELADVYHSDNLDRVSDDFIRFAGITEGDFDNVAQARYAVPSHWDIGKVYKRLVLGVAKEKHMDIIDALLSAYNSFVSEKIDDYNSSFYYEAPQNILNAYLYNEIE